MCGEACDAAISNHVWLSVMQRKKVFISIHTSIVTFHTINRAVWSAYVQAAGYLLGLPVLLSIPVATALSMTLWVSIKKR